jgi:hypothetical protein
MPRREFDLDEILGERYVRHYMRFIGGTQQQFYVDEDPEEPWTWKATQVRPPDEREGTVVERVGDGPDLCSSSYALDTLPGFVWDVCGYYRRLRVSWWATRRQLRLAYIDRGGHQGTGDARLAYALRQLLSDVIRPLYDRASPLRPFILDQDTAEAIKRAAALEAARRTARLGQAVNVDRVLEEFGFRQMKTEDAPPPADRLPPDTALPARPLGWSLRGWGTQWSWYIMDMADEDEDPATGWYLEYWRIMEVWQRALREELADQGVIMKFAVGLCKGSGHKLWPLSDGARIVFLGRETPPTREAARKAVTEMLS